MKTDKTLGSKELIRSVSELRQEGNIMKYKYGAPDKYDDFPCLYGKAQQWSDELADILRERLPDSYPMALVDQDEIDVLAEVVNMGIDAHLEAATMSERPHAIGHKYGIGFDRDGMICLIRRLMEYSSPDEKKWDAAYQLVSCILQTLSIDMV